MRSTSRGARRGVPPRPPATLLAVIISLSSVVACREPGLATDNHTQSVVASMSANSIRLVESRGRTWAINREDPFACFTSTASSTGPIPYLYKRHSLDIPHGVAKAAGAVEAMSYRVLDRQGRVRSVLNCIIPASSRARAIVAQRFNLYPTPEDDPGTVHTMGCTAIEPDGTCQLGPVTVRACGPGWLGEWPNCYRAFEPQCPALDPACGGFGGGDPGASGGGGSCTDCGPSTPTLTCTSVTRGETAQCVVSDGGAEIPSTSWRFTAINRNTIPGPDGPKWVGPGVLSGNVSAVPIESGMMLQATLTVLARNWRWSSDKASYSQGTATICENRVPGISLLLGWNLTRGSVSCVGNDNFPLQPDPRPASAGGSAVIRVSSGPNAGIAYVNALDYRLDRESNQNPAVQLGGPELALQGSDAAACGASASFYSYNMCRGVNTWNLLASVWFHEGYGRSGTNGHYSTAVRAAALAGNDVYALSESLLSDDGEGTSDFAYRVRGVVSSAGIRIANASSDQSGYVTGNWLDPIWIWDGNTQSFRSILLKL